MGTDSTIVYPQPKEELVKIAQDVFGPVKNYFCISCFFISGTGKRVVFKFLLQEKKILKDIFGKAFANTLFIYVDPDELINSSNEGYLELIRDSLCLAVQKNTSIKCPHASNLNPLLDIKDVVSTLISHNIHTVFILNDFEITLTLSPTIYRNLESVLALDKKLVTLMFVSNKNLLDTALIEKFHNLKYAINRVTYYHSMMNEVQIKYILGQMSTKLRITITPEIYKTLIDVCGGHPQLLKYCLHNLAKLTAEQRKSIDFMKSFLCNDTQLKTVCHDIWGYLNETEKELIIAVVKTGQLKDVQVEHAYYLLKTNILKKIDDKYRVFGELFADYIKCSLPKEGLLYDALTNEIYYGGINYTNKFSLQEFKLLVHFIKNQDKVISRDEVGQVLWGSNYVEKFSDWSIDKIISVMRKKLTEIEYPTTNLVTLKRRGFSFSNNSGRE